MPELPEVETVVRQLNATVKGKTIVAIDVLDRKVISSTLPKIVPATIINIQRRGKSIIFNLDKNRHLLAHLRMTGHFYYVPPGGKDISYKQYHVGTFHLQDRSFLTHNSIRRFGRISALTQVQLNKTLSALGIEPLSKECTSQKFIALIQSKPSANIKNCLLDQHLIAGIGNIYAQEALYRAGIHPEKKVREIPSSQLSKLHHSLQELLKDAINHNGTTIQNYAHITGKGEFQDFLAVYQCQQCPKKHTIERIVQGGRSTYYCSRCQR